MKYHKGSIISFRSEDLHAISIVDKVVDNNLYCKVSICSLDGGLSYRDTTDVYKDYEGEESQFVSLIDTDDFDVIIDSELLPINKIKNIKIN